jgi:hypothetical protein
MQFDADMPPAPPVERSWMFAAGFAAGGFFVGGLVVFGLGLRAFFPPPVPEGTAACGTPVLGGLFLMVIGAPAAAIACSIAGGIVGAVLDRVLR